MEKLRLREALDLACGPRLGRVAGVVWSWVACLQSCVLVIDPQPLNQNYLPGSPCSWSDMTDATVSDTEQTSTFRKWCHCGYYRPCHLHHHCITILIAPERFPFCSFCSGLDKSGLGFYKFAYLYLHIYIYSVYIFIYTK